MILQPNRIQCLGVLEELAFYSGSAFTLRRRRRRKVCSPDLSDGAGAVQLIELGHQCRVAPRPLAFIDRVVGGIGYDTCRVALHECILDVFKV